MKKVLLNNIYLSKKKGITVLTLVILISVIGLTLAMEGLVLSQNQVESNLVEMDARRAEQNALSCVDYAIEQLKLSSVYVPTNPITIDATNTCTIDNIFGSGNEDRIILTSSTVGNVTKKKTAKINTLAPSVSIDYVRDQEESDLQDIPVIKSVSPASGSVDVDPTSDLVVNFSKPVVKGSGNIEIRKVSDDSLVESIDVTSANVTGQGISIITINPVNSLLAGTEVYVLVNGTAFKDTDGRSFTGINDKTTWKFFVGTFFPNWATNFSTPESLSTIWTATQNALNDLIASNTQTETVSTFGSLSGTYGWLGGVLVPNGMIYGIPKNATSILKINPNNDTTSTFGNLPAGDWNWEGGVLAPNGMIYGIPTNATSILKINPNTDTATTFGSLGSGEKWSGGVLAPNGMIYGIPEDSTSILKIDPNTDTVTTFGSLSGTDKWFGGVLAPNGMIYGMPRSSTSVLKIDPNTDTVTTFGSLSGTDKWCGGVLAPNGMIYATPHSAVTILKINPSTDTVTTFGNLPVGTWKWTSGVLASNGMIYGIPQDITSILKINPSTDTVTTFGSVNSGWKWIGGVLAPNGSLYGIPAYTTTVLKILSPMTLDTNFPLSRFFNKY